MSQDAAEVYEDAFVPAMFAEWAPRVADAAEITRGARVLDVACGTGIVAREAAARVGREGRVVGLDLNGGMLAVARRKAPDIEWREGNAEALPFADASFDIVTCQFGLMFLEDPELALREMRRVARAGGRVVAVVWDALDKTPGESAMVQLLEKHGGQAAAAALRVPFRLGDATALRRLFQRAGLADVDVRTMMGSARYPSVDAYVETSIDGWTFADAISPGQRRALAADARSALAAFVQPGGTLTLPAPAHLAVARCA